MDTIHALFMELSELSDSLPWKKWRPLKDQMFDQENYLEEIVDIIFFLGSLLEIWEFHPKKVVAMFERKLEENYKRIEEGYNAPPSES